MTRSVNDGGAAAPLAAVRRPGTKVVADPVGLVVLDLDVLVLLSVDAVAGATKLTDNSRLTMFGAPEQPAVVAISR